MISISTDPSPYYVLDVPPDEAKDVFEPCFLLVKGRPPRSSRVDDKLFVISLMCNLFAF